MMNFGGHCMSSIGPEGAAEGGLTEHEGESSSVQTGDFQGRGYTHRSSESTARDAFSSAHESGRIGESDAEKEVSSASSITAETPEEILEGLEKSLERGILDRDRFALWLKKLKQVDVSQRSKKVFLGKQSGGVVKQGFLTVQQIEQKIEGVLSILMAVPEEVRGSCDQILGFFDRFIDSHFDALSIPSKTQQGVAFFVEERNGLGDLMLAGKAIKAVKDRHPGLPIRVFLGVNNLSFEDAVRKITEQIQLESEIRQVSKKNKEGYACTRGVNAAVIVSIPDEPGRFLKTALEGWKRRPEILCLSEYGRGDPLCEGGLRETSLGIFLQEERDKSSNRTSGKILKELKNETLRHVLFEAGQAETYGEMTKLYFGYSQTEYATPKFIEAIIKLNMDNDKNIDFFVRTENYIVDKGWGITLNGGLSYLQFKEGPTEEGRTEVIPVDRSDPVISYDIFRECGVSQVDLIRFERVRLKERVVLSGRTVETKRRFEQICDEGKGPRIRQESFTIENPRGNKRIRILDFFPLEHSDMLTMWKGSEAECLSTGDQSFGEAVSLNKRPFYEMLAHKQDFSRQIQELASRIDDPLAAVMKKMQIDGRRETEYNGVDALLSSVPDLHERFLAYRKTIFENFNLGRRFSSKINRALWTQNPSTLRHLGRINQIVDELSRQNSPENMMSFLFREAPSDLVNFQAEIRNVMKENPRR